MLERRRLTRTRIFAPAIVIPNGGSFVWGCYVRDITSNGARLEFPSAPVIPSVFNLTFDSAKTLRACHLVWRIANEVGVRLSATDLGAPLHSSSYQPEPLGPRSAIGQRFPEAAINLARGEQLDGLNFRKRPCGFYQ